MENKENVKNTVEINKENVKNTVADNKKEIDLGFIVLAFLLPLLAVILYHPNNINLDKFHVAADDSNYSYTFDYTGKPNLPETLQITGSHEVVTRELSAKTDYEFANDESREKSKTGGIIELKGKGNYIGTIKVKIHVNKVKNKAIGVQCN